MSSADSSTALPDNAVSSPTPPETEIKPPAPQKKRWADEEDDPAEDSKPSSSTPTLESIVENLKIDENKKINKFLDEPEDSKIKAVTTGETPYTFASSFEDLKLSSDLLKGLSVEMKSQKLTKIQAISLPMILTPPYKDLIAQAANGSGKTTCFVLGVLSRVDPNLKAPQALCICPTKELAIRNMEVLRKMGMHTGITSEHAVPMDSTNYILINKPAPVSAQIVIGTPGTIKRWMSVKRLAVNNVKILLFDEADHMLTEDGFEDDSLRIKKDIERSSRHCQVLLFSATFNETVDNFVAKIVKDYNRLYMKKGELYLASVKQYKVYCPDENTKIQINKDRNFDLGENLGQRMIIQTKHTAGKLDKQLVDDGSTSVCCGNKEANRVNHNDVLERPRTNEDENSNREKELAMVKKELEDTRREAWKDITTGWALAIEEIKKAQSKELLDITRVHSTKLEQVGRAHSAELEEMKRVHSTKREDIEGARSIELEEAKRAHSVEHKEICILHTTEYREICRLHTTKSKEILGVHSAKLEEIKGGRSIELEEARRARSIEVEDARIAHSAKLEEARRTHSAKLEEARKAYSTKLEEIRRGHSDKLEKAEIAHSIQLEEARGAHFIQLEETKGRHSTKLKNARSAHFTKLEEARRRMEELRKKYELA